MPSGTPLIAIVQASPRVLTVQSSLFIAGNSKRGALGRHYSSEAVGGAGEEREGEGEAVHVECLWEGSPLTRRISARCERGRRFSHPTRDNCLSIFSMELQIGFVAAAATAQKGREWRKQAAYFEW